jgi:hypothetical protein
MTGRLTDDIRPPKPGPDSQAPQASPQPVPPGQELADVYLTTAVRTSAGPGPGVKRLPAAEANRLIARKHAVSGTEPPRGYMGLPEGPDRPFDDNYNPQGSRRDDGLRH